MTHEGQVQPLMLSSPIPDNQLDLGDRINIKGFFELNYFFTKAFFRNTAYFNKTWFLVIQAKSPQEMS